MRHFIDLHSGWLFTGPDGQTIEVNIPHTWNNIDGQDGGGNYRRGACLYRHAFPMPAFDAENEEVWLEFDGVNATAHVKLNGHDLIRHEGGYSAFRAQITHLLKKENLLDVVADNSVSDHVYPQRADFTFYGGIYRGVRLVIVHRIHFAMDHLASSGVRVTATPEGAGAKVRVQSRVTGGEVAVTLIDREGRIAGTGEGTDTFIEIPDAHRWHGVEDPYLYTCRVELKDDGEVKDQLDIPFGVRSYRVDPKLGFILNDQVYPLRGVARHQDRKGVGSALTRAMHEEDIALIAEMGCNTVRLAHYQHDPYFYDLCDRAGMVVWAEIPYISRHMKNGRQNTIDQMRELIEQNYNHASIVFWGLSNEITLFPGNRKGILDNHRVLNDMIHESDPSRLTTLACFMLCSPFHPIAHITDVVSWNLYMGWYIPGMFLNDLWFRFFRLCFPNKALGLSEYGAEGMPNLHASRPRRNDHTEEYQAKYHEYMLKCFRRNPRLWATHAWNMFDFAADTRDQGGEAGMNHKGLVTFDRKIKKDAFYLYKAWWSKERFVHICSKRYVERCEDMTTIKVYSTERDVTLYVNGQLFATRSSDDHIFVFKNVPLNGTIHVEAVCEELHDAAAFVRVAQPNPDYVLKKSQKRMNINWI